MRKHKNPYFSDIIGNGIMSILYIFIAFLGFIKSSIPIFGVFGIIGIIGIIYSNVILGYYISEFNRFEEFIKMKQQIEDMMTEEENNPFEDFDKRGEE